MKQCKKLQKNNACSVAAFFLYNAPASFISFIFLLSSIQHLQKILSSFFSSERQENCSFKHEMIIEIIEIIEK